MHLLAQLPASLALLTLAILRADAANVVDMLSFGIGSKVSDDGRTVNGWRVSGDGYEPQVLSDKIILTPPSPGSKRGSAWADKSSPYSEWNLGVDFRVSGPDRGSGNMQIWYAKDGEKEVGSNSVFTSPKFEGLVLLVDQYGGKGGSIRGFLNDGSTSYKDHHQVDQLAFGHCDFSYRNLGVFTHLTLRQTPSDFEVEVNGQQCFKTNKVQLPSGYQFGLSAASAETPDSFEISQFIVEASHTNSPDSSRHEPYRDETPDKRHTADESPDAPASQFHTLDEQFQDLHNRLMAMHHQLSGLVHDFESMRMHQEESQAVLVNRYLNPIHDFQDDIFKKVKALEQTVEKMRGEFDTQGFQNAVHGLHDMLSLNHDTVMSNIPNLAPAEAPRLGFFVFVIIAFQLILAGSYILYKRRKNSMPKKYL